MKKGPLVDGHRSLSCRIAGRTYLVRHASRPRRWELLYVPRGCRATYVLTVLTLPQAREEAARQWLIWELGSPAVAACEVVRQAVEAGTWAGLAGEGADPLAVLALADWCEERGGKAAEWLRMVAVRGSGKRVAWPPGWQDVAARLVGARARRKPLTGRAAAAAAGT